MMKTINRSVLGFGVLALSACGGTDESLQATRSGDVFEERAALASGVRNIDHDLTIGARGADVLALNTYLLQHGFFPDAEMSRKNPRFRPVLGKAPASLDVFDEQTALALRELQNGSGIAETGIVDEATRAYLQSDRCTTLSTFGVQESDKFALAGSRWGTAGSGATVTWRVTNTDDVTLTQARTAAAAAFTTWRNQTNINFTELTSGTADIMIGFSAIDGVGKTLAFGFYPTNGDITVDTAETWSVAASPPSGSQDLQTVLLHEIGHAIGLNHSGLTQATMYPFVGFDRTLDVDDTVGISAVYDTWQTVSGAQARDIGVGSNGRVWTISNTANGSNFNIQRYNGTSWQTDPGVGVRIAVEPGGNPWVVQADGSIWWKDTDSATSGDWWWIDGCARDIAVGADGNVWVIGCNATTGGFDIYQFDGFLSWIWTAGGAVRIAVGPTGVPWVVDSSGRVYRRTTNSASSGSWTLMPGGNIANDIGVGPLGNAYIIGRTAVSGGNPILVWNFQNQVLYSDGSVAAPAVNQWTPVQGGGVGVSVGPNDTPWVVNSARSIFRPLR